MEITGSDKEGTRGDWASAALGLWDGARRRLCGEHSVEGMGGSFRLTEDLSVSIGEEDQIKIMQTANTESRTWGNRPHSDPPFNTGLEGHTLGTGEAFRLRP